MTRLNALLDIALILFLTIAAGLLAFVVGQGLDVGPYNMPVIIAVQGLIITAGVVALVRFRRLSWRGFWMVTPRLQDLWRGLWLLLIIFAVSLVMAGVLYPFWPERYEAHNEQLGGLGSQLTGGLSVPGMVAMMLFVGFYEELVARGALLSRTRALVGGVWLPVLLSSLLFGLGHAYQGWIGVLQTTAAGVVLARGTLHYGTLWPAVIAHALLNSISLLVLSQL